MTSPEITYWDRSVRSTPALRARSAGRREHEVARLEIGREHDRHAGERLSDLGVLGDQDGRRPLLPVRALAVRERHRAVPALELVGEERLLDVLTLVALGRRDGVGDDLDLRVPVEGAVDRLFLELRLVLLAEGLAAGGQLHGRVVVDD